MSDRPYPIGARVRILRGFGKDSVVTVTGDGGQYSRKWLYVELLLDGKKMRWGLLIKEVEEVDLITELGSLV